MGQCAGCIGREYNRSRFSTNSIHTTWSHRSAGDNWSVLSSEGSQLGEPLRRSPPFKRLHDFIDSHAHILEYGFTKILPLEGTQTISGQRFYYQTLSAPAVT